jgi:hypothetical protein
MYIHNFEMWVRAAGCGLIVRMRGHEGMTDVSEEPAAFMLTEMYCCVPSFILLMEEDLFSEVL